MSTCLPILSCPLKDTHLKKKSFFDILLNAEPDFTKDAFENQFKTPNLKETSSLKRRQNEKHIQIQN